MNLNRAAGKVQDGGQGSKSDTSNHKPEIAKKK